MKLKPFKIRTVNESHSREIQEWLFSLGYTWNCGSRYAKELKATFLYLERGIFTDDDDYDDLTLSFGYGEEFFETQNLPEAWFYDGKIHYEPKPQPLPEFKIKVESPEHSRKIQEFVFSMGYHWWSVFTEPNQEVKHLGEEYLYFKKSGIENKLTLSVTSNSRTFNSLNIPEMWFYGGKLRDEPSQLESQPQPKTYRQVAEALLAGKKLQQLESNGNWIPINYMGLNPLLLDETYPYEVRLKPRICNGVELDPCVVSEPEMYSSYYYPDPTLPYFYDMTSWRGSYQDKHLLKSGMIYLHRHSAVEHGKAMVITDDN